MKIMLKLCAKKGCKIRIPIVPTSKITGKTDVTTQAYCPLHKGVN